MFNCNLSRGSSSFCRIVHHVHTVVPVDMINNLFTQREKSFFMGFFIFVNMNRGDLQSAIPICFNFFIGDAFVILPDMYH